jgi:glutathionyl-hydroquinone reductase
VGQSGRDSVGRVSDSGEFVRDPVLRAYARDLFQAPGFGDTTDFQQAKEHCYKVHTSLNPSKIIPAGPDLSGWITPHHREELGGRPFGDGTPPGPPPPEERVAAGPDSRS